MCRILRGRLAPAFYGEGYPASGMEERWRGDGLFRGQKSSKNQRATEVGNEGYALKWRAIRLADGWKT